jgi:hypothetical protein
MLRRRRRPREIPFSFDSFLDVVANVVGIIIRLILVVWVGARSYSTLTNASAHPQRKNAQVSDASQKRPQPEPHDPLQNELGRHEQELAALQARLLEQLRQVQQLQTSEHEAERELSKLEAWRRLRLEERGRVDRAANEQRNGTRTVVLSLAELRKKSRQLRHDITELEKLPRRTHSLRYYTPVSEPVDAEEMLFECRNGRVTFVDIAALLEEVRHSMEDKGKLLRTRWRVEDVAGPVGAFRLYYTVERRRELLESAVGDAEPSAVSGYRYGLSEWHVEPITEERGETARAALAAGSEFRHIVDALDPHQAVVTFWIYPDSFGLYRQLRDYLYGRDVVVAGRPLPEGVPISCSRSGTRSRGQ